MSIILLRPCIYLHFLGRYCRWKAALGGIQEVWPAVSKQVNLTLALALDPVVTFALLTLLVLADEEEVRGNAPNAKEQRKVSKYHAVADSVLWCVILQVNVA